MKNEAEVLRNAGVVIAWLEDPDCKPDDPVRLLRERVNHPLEGRDVHGIIESIRDQEDKWVFHYRRVISVTPEGLKQDLVHVSNLPIGSEHQREAKMLLAWNHAVLLWVRGLLTRIRACARGACARLYFAKRSDQEYCSNSCRLIIESENPEYKIGRRLNARRRRAEAKKGAKHERLSKTRK